MILHKEAMGSFLKNVYFKYMERSFRKQPRFLLRFEEEREILDKFEDPKTDIERAFFQYCCQQKVCMDWKTRLLFNIASLLAFFPTIMVLFIYSFFSVEKEKKEVIFALPLPDALIPRELKNRIDEKIVLKRENERLSFNDIKFIFKIVKRYPFSPFFCYKCAFLIAVYAYGIHKYQPKMILTTEEFSFAASVLTMYCEQLGIQHCNIQHGEKLFNIRDAFCRFSKFYIWDAHYLKLFEDLRTGTRREDFILYSPMIQKLPICGSGNSCTYYLQMHTRKELIVIKECLKKLKKEYKVRPHPAYVLEDIDEIFGESCIESPCSVSIFESIISTKLVVSMYSTVLFQAYLMNIPIVIDDISNPEDFAELKKRKYIMLDKPHTLLSELVNGKQTVKA